MRLPFSKRSTPFQRGFTLIEMVLVMGLIGSIVGVAAVAASSGSEERELRQVSGGIEDVIRQARNLSLLQQRAYIVTFSDGKVMLAPLGNQKQQSALKLSSPFRQDEEEPKSQFKDVRTTKNIDDGYTVEIRRWGQKLFAEIEDKVVHELIFEPSGLVEPVIVRVSKGESYIQTSFSPLSGAVNDEEFYISGKG